TEYGRRENGEWVAVERYPDDIFVRRLRGAELVGRQYRGPFDDLGPAAGVDHRVVAWDEVALDQGTGVVHIAPGCGTDDFDLGRELGLATLAPVDEEGRFYPEYEWLGGLTTGDAAEPIIDRLRDRDVLHALETYEHAYPHCWRCHTPLIFRIADDWHISADEIRPRLIDANASIKWMPSYFGKRMTDWLRNMGDWNISRRRYFGLPLPFYPCLSCDHLTVVGSKAELEQRSVAGAEQLEELHRPWIDAVVIRCAGCGGQVERVRDVGDVWLDAGIVPLSTLGWDNPAWRPEGNATGAAAGVTTADLPDHAYWEEWFPADWVSEMREQIRLWFYSMLFMSVTLVGRPPYKSVLGYEKLLDEHGREMHGSWGNTIGADEAFEKMGADVMRWQFCAQSPDRDLLFGFSTAHKVKRKLLTMWNSARFFVEYANIESFQPQYDELASGPSGNLSALDTWLVTRTHRLVADATDAYDSMLPYRVIREIEAYIDDLSNWYIRRSRRRFWSGSQAALSTLWWSLVQLIRVCSPILPFLSEYLWKTLVSDVCDNAPDSVFLARWPEAGEVDDELIAEIRDVRTIVELGRRVRAMSQVKLRQPLRQALVHGALRARSHVTEIAEELRLKNVRFETSTSDITYKPNFRALGPRLGRKLPAIKQALDEGRYEVQDDTVLVEGVALTGDDLTVERKPAGTGWPRATGGDVVVELNTELDDELRLEGRMLDLIHAVNTMRKERGLALTNRIVLTVPETERDVLTRYSERIKQETLATEVRIGEAIAVATASRSDR
ncbi:MAG: class I tRNA ligase family protein, partial [Candidatus Limnocylindria bacterium]